jgi:hypothetical protein
MLDEDSTIDDVADVDGAIEVASETMLGDLTKFVLEEIRAIPDVWQKLPEMKMQIVIDRVEKRCRKMIDEMVRLVSTGDAPSIVATLESVTMKDELKATLKMSRGAERRHELVDAQGSQVLVVMPRAFDGGAGTVKPDPLQIQLTLGDDAAARELQVIADKFSPEPVVNEATLRSEAEKLAEHIAIVAKGTKRPYSEIARENGTTLEALAERTGLTVAALIAVMDDTAGHESDVELEAASAKTEPQSSVESEATALIGRIAKLAKDRNTRDYRALFEEENSDPVGVSRALGLPHWKALTELIDSVVDATRPKDATAGDGKPRPFTIKAKSGNGQNIPHAGGWAACAEDAWTLFCFANPGYHARADFYIDEIKPEAAAQVFASVRKLNDLDADGNVIAAPKAEPAAKPAAPAKPKRRAAAEAAATENQGGDGDAAA